MPNLYELKGKCDLAAEAIRQLPETQWPSWITYILEILDPQTETLEEIDIDLSIRLAAGRW